MIKIYNFVIFWDVHGAAQMHLAGHMWPAGRVFETPGLNEQLTNTQTGQILHLWLPWTPKTIFEDPEEPKARFTKLIKASLQTFFDFKIFKTKSLFETHDI